MVGETDFVEDGGEAVGEIDVRSRATAVGWASLATGEPMLVIHTEANVEARGDLGIDTCTKRDEVIAGSGAALIEGGG